MSKKNNQQQSNGKPIIIKEGREIPVPRPTNNNGNSNNGGSNSGK